MSRTLGAPFGGMIRGAHQGVDSDALSLITPPNLGSGGGSWLPLIVVVPPGEPTSLPIASRGGVAAVSERGVCALARLASQDPAYAVATAALAADRNSCLRFICAFSPSVLTAVCTDDAAESYVARATIDHLRMPRRRSIALTVVRCAEIRAALDYLARDVDRGCVGS
jgi:hypothetical protein